MDIDEVMARAFRAYFMTAKREGIRSPDQPANWSGLEEAAGKTYAVLANGNGILAVYRVRNDGMLKRLRRWPRELETNAEA